MSVIPNTRSTVSARWVQAEIEGKQFLAGRASLDDPEGLDLLVEALLEQLNPPQAPERTESPAP